MKKIYVVLVVCLIQFTGCSSKVDRPKITISDYTTQALTTKGVVQKIMDENDHKKMHDIALALESSRAVSCVSISEECNLLGQILNKIVNSTQKGMPSATESTEIYSMINQLDNELKIGHEKLALQWGEYIKSQGQRAK
ncbi:MAG: hypothetical protein EHM20_07135 [Alphaproteobacteria bacterium]|nr:MAG: hypothetical protein EHM20_07135 [Alphaproteobacteria bacterium]